MRLRYINRSFHAGATRFPIAARSRCRKKYDLDSAVGPQIAEADTDHLGHAQAGIEQEQEHPAVALAGGGQQATQIGVGQRLDDLARHERSGQPTERPGAGQAVADQPVAEGAQATHVAGHAHR